LSLKKKEEGKTLSIINNNSINNHVTIVSNDILTLFLEFINLNSYNLAD